VAFQENDDVKPVQSTDYYPFGLAMNVNEVSDNKYLFNGKELQEETDWIDYHARFYDPQLGRWYCIDPLAESYYSQSSYHFSGNNPIRFVDPNDMFYDEWEYNIDTKEATWVSDKGGDQTQYVNVVDNEGTQVGEANVSGSEAYVYSLRDGVMVTDYDAKFDDDTYNSKTGYEYTTEEFQLRNDLMKDEDSPIRTYVISQEQVGKAFPLTKSEEELHYGYTVSRLKMFGFAIETSLGIAGGRADFPSVRINQGGKLFNGAVPSLKSSAPLKASSGLKSGLGKKQLRRLYRKAKKEFGGK
jgi:RHS repeat-associated protein